MILLCRVENAHQSLPFATLGTEFEVFDRSAGHDLFGTTLQIFNRYVGNVLLQESLCIGGFLKSFRANARGDNAIDDCLLYVADPSILS